MTKLPHEYRYRVEIHRRVDSWSYHYIIVAEGGAIDFHVTIYDDPREGFEPTAGLEAHYRSPPPYMQGQAPSQDRCGALGGACCWHDGTSLYAHEKLLPRWEARRNETEVFDWLVSEVDRFTDDKPGSEETEAGA